MTYFRRGDRVRNVFSHRIARVLDASDTWLTVEYEVRVAYGPEDEVLAMARRDHFRLVSDNRVVPGGRRRTDRSPA